MALSGFPTGLSAASAGGVFDDVAAQGAPQMPPSPVGSDGGLFAGLNVGEAARTAGGLGAGGQIGGGGPFTTGPLGNQHGSGASAQAEVPRTQNVVPGGVGGEHHSCRGHDQG